MRRQRSGRLTSVAALFVVVQALLGARVLWRLMRTGRRRVVVPESGEAARFDTVGVIVPVLNERGRLAPCLEGLLLQGSEVAQILVVDGGSDDGTQELVSCFAARDARVQLIDASPVPSDWNGKAWGLQRGLECVDPNAEWILTIDADVRPRARLASSLVWHARRFRLSALSVATRQEIETAGEGLVHPALLTTLVYRFGIPGGATRRVSEVQANGQCFLVRRPLVLSVGGFASVRSSVCEDVTLAREIAVNGAEIGFFEAGDLVSARMYRNGWETLREWPRSLPMRDRYFGLPGILGLLEVLLVQALPLPLLLGLRLSGAPRWLSSIETMLMLARLGVLVGTRRAYRHPCWTYWLSPAFDLPASLLLLASAVRRRFLWRGRVLARGGIS